MSDKLVTLASYPYSRAELLKTKLADAGIESFLINVNTIRSIIGSGVKVRIREEDIEKALEIALEMETIYGEEKLKNEEIVEDVRKILVPIDFSVYSEHACDYALGIADKLGAEVCLMHSYYFNVMPLFNFSDPYSYQTNIDEALVEIKEKTEKDMNTFVQKTKDKIKDLGLKNVEIKEIFVNGTPIDEIMNTINDYKPGLVVMGTRGHSEKKEDFFGSVTSSVIEEADIPVLAIPEVSKYRGVNKTNILYITDFDNSDTKAIRKLMTLVYAFDVKIYCLHIGHSKWDKLLMKNIEKNFEENYKGYNMECVIIDSDDKVKGIEEFVKDKNIDIIAMTTHKRGIVDKFLHQDFTQKMLFHSDTPLLVFHSN